MSADEPRPSVPGAPDPHNRAGRWRAAVSFDAAAVLSVYFFLTLAVPSGRIFAPLGTVGAPSTIVAVLVFAWWIWDHVHRTRPGQQQVQLVRRAAVGLVLLMLVVYRHAMMQPLVPDEVMPADSGLIRFMALMGIILVATDGITSKSRWHILMNRMATGAVAVAALAVIQSVTGQLWIDRITIPGFTDAGSAEVLSGRGDLLRASGTASHPIEFGAVLGIMLPIVINRARLTTTHRLAAKAGLAVMILAILVSVSRTALICSALGFLILLPSWSPKSRWVALASVTGSLFVASLVIPGLLGTLRGMFQGSADDPSVLSRTAGYAYAQEVFVYNPWLGKGYGTFLPRYYIFDNGYLQWLMEAGVVGLAGFLTLLTLAMLSAWRASRIYSEYRDQEMSRALLAAVAAGSASVAFFDLFAFPQSASCLVLCIGLCGAAHRLARDEQQHVGPDQRVVSSRSQPC